MIPAHGPWEDCRQNRPPDVYSVSRSCQQSASIDFSSKCRKYDAVSILTGINTQSVQLFAARQCLVLVVRYHLRDCRSELAKMIAILATLAAIARRPVRPARTTDTIIVHTWREESEHRLKSMPP